MPFNKETKSNQTFSSEIFVCAHKMSSENFVIIINLKACNILKTKLLTN